MRISLSAAVAALLALTVTVEGRPSWGVVSYGGGEAASSHATGDENAAHEKKNATALVAATIAAASHMRSAVSAGGGAPGEATAFVAAASAPAKAGTPTKESPSASSSLLGTHPPKMASTGTTTPSDDGAAATSDKRPLRILFLSSDTGGGHRASAEALATQFQRHFPGATYSLLDIWSEIDSRWPYNTITDTYKSFSATPWKWRTLYHVSNNALYSKFVDAHSYYMNEEMIREKMASYDPDVVVSVHPTMNYVPLFALRKIAEKLQKTIPFFTVVTDFGSGHCTWFHNEVDKIYLASEPIKEIAHKRGQIPNSKIVMTGLPIRNDFAAQADAMVDRTTEEGKAHQVKIREQLNIATDKRMILVMGGGEGVGALSDIVDEIYAKLRTQGVDATICVVCGRNEKLRMELDTRCWETVVSQSLQSYESLKSRFYTKFLSINAHRSRRIQLALDRAAARAGKGESVAVVLGRVDVVPLGFVSNMAEYMVAADILVTKAGPGTIAEAAAVGLPVMVTSHLPGQEAGNVDIVLNGGFGDFCAVPETIGLEVACWLQDAPLLDDMSRKARGVGHPHAAEEIALDIGNATRYCMEQNERQRHNNGT